MKKIILMMLTALVALSLSACSLSSIIGNIRGGDEPDGTLGEPELVDPEPDDDMNIEDKIAEAVENGFNVVSGTIHEMTDMELIEFQNEDLPEEAIEEIRDEDTTFYIVEFDEPTLVYGSYSDGSGIGQEYANLLSIGSMPDGAEDGESIVIAFSPDEAWFPSDVSLPLGEPTVNEYEFLGKDYEVESDFNKGLVESSGGYTDEQLLDAAREYYISISDSDFVPPNIEISSEEDGVVSIHLYEIVENEDDGHTSTYDWYYIDRTTGTGTNFLDEFVDLTPYIEE